MPRKKKVNAEEFAHPTEVKSILPIDEEDEVDIKEAEKRLAEETPIPYVPQPPNTDELMHETLMILNEVCTSMYGMRSKWNDDDPAVKQFYKFEELIGRFYGKP
jgi:hypothetical protein